MDRLTTAIQPLTGFTGMTPEQMAKMLLSEEAALCAKCFNDMDHQQPLVQYVSNLVNHPTKLPNLFQFRLMKKGAGHVD
jgi:hypothetical protein